MSRYEEDDLDGVMDIDGEPLIIDTDHLAAESDGGVSTYTTESRGPQRQETMSGGVIIGLLALLVVSRSIDYVLYVRVSTQMRNYVWFLGSIILSLVFCIISWPVVWFKLHVSKTITPAMRQTPQRVFFYIGILDALGNILGTIPAPHVSGPLQVVLAQLTIPTNMFVSFLFLHTRYRLTHALGVGCIISGVLVALIPDFQNNTSHRHSNGFQWILLLLIAILPGAISNVYKEQWLKKADFDVWYFNAFVATYQLMFGMLTAPMVFIQFFAGDTPAITPSEMPQYIERATMCFFGSNSQPGDACDSTPYVFAIYIMFNLIFNISLLLVFKHGSATLAVVASASRVALSEFGFTIKFIAGNAYHPLSIFDGAALIVLLFGLVLYRMQKEYSLPEKRKDMFAVDNEGADPEEADVLLGSGHGDRVLTTSSNAPDVVPDIATTPGMSAGVSDITADRGYYDPEPYYGDNDYYED